MPPEPRSPKYQSLDIWRGVACLMVVVFHSTYCVSGTLPWSLFDPASMLIVVSKRLWMGVPLFFVISGYCISATVDSSHRHGQPARDYFLRRFRRIFPPYWIWITLCCACLVVGDRLFTGGLPGIDENGVVRPSQLSNWQWLGNLTLTEIWRAHFTGPNTRLLLAHAWTLCYEEQFYAVAGLILLLVPRHYFRGAALVTLFALASQALCYLRGYGPTHGVFFDGYWELFAAGILVYYQVNYATAQQRLWLDALLLAGVLFAAHSPRALLEEHANYRQFLCFGLAFALLISRLQPWDAAIASTRWLRPLAVCGTMCYSIYLVHWPMVYLLSRALQRVGLHGHVLTAAIVVPICLVVSVTIGGLFHVAVERRFLNRARRPAESAQAAAAPAIAGRFPALHVVHPAAIAASRDKIAA